MHDSIKQAIPLPSFCQAPPPGFACSPSFPGSLEAQADLASPFVAPLTALLSWYQSMYVEIERRQKHITLLEQTVIPSMHEQQAQSNAKFEAELSLLRGENGRLQIELLSVRVNSNGGEEKLAAERAEKFKLVEEHTVRVHALREEADRLRIEVSYSQAQMEETAAKLEQARAQIAYMEDLECKEQYERNQHSASIDHLIDRLKADMKLAKMEYEETLGTAQEQISELEARREQLLGLLEERSQTIGRLTHMNQTTTDAIELVRKEAVSMRTQVDELKEKITLLDADLVQQKRKGGVIDGLYQLSQVTIKELRKELAMKMAAAPATEVKPQNDFCVRAVDSESDSLLSYMHNMTVFSNTILNIEKYHQDQSSMMKFAIKHISTLPKKVSKSDVSFAAIDFLTAFHNEKILRIQESYYACTIMQQLFLLCQKLLDCIPMNWVEGRLPAVQRNLTISKQHLFKAVDRFRNMKTQESQIERLAKRVEDLLQIEVIHDKEYCMGDYSELKKMYNENLAETLAEQEEERKEAKA